MKKIFLASVAMLAVGGADAAEPNRVLLTSVAAKGAQLISIDFLSAGEVGGFQAKISLPAAVTEKQVDLAACTRGLPKGFSASCTLKDGAITIAAFDSAGNAALKAGVHSVGQIRVPTGAVSVSNVAVSDNAGKLLPASSEVN